MKKEISDHIANAFFEKKSNGKKENNLSFFLAVSLVIVVSFVIGLLLSEIKGKGFLGLEQGISLEKPDGPYGLNFNFSDSPLKIQTLNIDIPDIDLSAYKKIKFSIRFKNSDRRQPGNLKVSFINRRNESSSLYISKIHNSWEKFVLPLSDFGKIYDWSHLAKLSFTAEEWNLSKQKGEFLIDGIEFLKN